MKYIWIIILIIVYAVWSIAAIFDIKYHIKWYGIRFYRYIDTPTGLWIFIHIFILFAYSFVSYFE